MVELINKIHEKYNKYIEEQKLREIEYKKHIIDTILRPMSKAQVHAHNKRKMNNNFGWIGDSETEYKIKMDLLKANYKLFTPKEYAELRNHIRKESDKTFTLFEIRSLR